MPTLVARSPPLHLLEHTEFPLVLLHAAYSIGRHSAGILMTILRRAGLQGTELATARFDTIRARLIKLAGRIKVSVRRVRISLSSVYPLQELFAQALTALRAAPVCVAPVRVAPG